MFVLYCHQSIAESDLGQLVSRSAASLERDDSVGIESSYYLEVIVNGVAAKLIVTCQRRGRDWWTMRSHLRALGLRVDDLQPDADGWVNLNDISGLSYRYDAAEQRLHVTVLASRRDLYVLRNVPKTPTGDSAAGMLFNYDAIVEHQLGETSLRAFTEQRLFGDWGVVSHGGIYSTSQGDSKYVRLDTVWAVADQEAMRTATVGDLINRSLSWSRSVRLAGVQFSRNFALSPDLVTYPVAEFAGEAAVPSTVDVYINQVRQFSSDVPAGPFRIEAPPAVNGAGQATMVVRDALGRDSVQTLDLYVVPQLLAEGLSDYSFETGLLRENFGLSSNDYRGGLVGSGTLRYGFSDWVTVESHAEAADGLYQFGTGALLKLGRYGRLNTSVSLSRAGGTGGKFGIGYQYVSQRVSVTADLQQASDEYRDLPALLGDLPARRQMRVFIGSQLSPSIHLSASYLVADVPRSTLSFGDPPAGEDAQRLASSTRLASVGFRQRLGRGVSLSANAFHDLERSDSGGVYAGFSVAFGRSAHLQADYSSADERGGISASRRSPYAGGWDWNLRGTRGEHTNYQAGSRYTGAKGSVSLDFSGEADAHRWQLGGRGALALAGKTLVAGRYVQDEFAVISTNGMSGVPVLHENRLAGHTNSNGYLLLSNVNAYQSNQVAIDPLAVPFGYRIDRHERTTTPRLSAGTTVRFPIEDPRGVSLRLVDERGGPLKTGSRGAVLDSGVSFVVGYGGAVYLTGVQGRTQLRVETETGACEASVSRHPDASTQPDMGSVVCHGTYNVEVQYKGSTNIDEDGMPDAVNDAATELDTQTATLQSIDTELFEQTVALADVNNELDAQTAELQGINSELDVQTDQPQGIDAELDAQTGELQGINSELDTQTGQLSGIGTGIDDINEELNTQAGLLQGLTEQAPDSADTSGIVGKTRELETLTDEQIMAVGSPTFGPEGDITADDSFLGVFTGLGICTDMVLGTPPRTITIACAGTQDLRNVLGWALRLYLLWALVAMILTPIPGRK